MQLQYQVALLATVMVICNYNQLQLIMYFLKYDTVIVIRQLKYKCDTYFCTQLPIIQLSSLLCQ